MNFKLIKTTRKSVVLKNPAVGCLKATPGINVTAGCIHRCVYCYARVFTNTPFNGEIHLYTNLPEMLERELQHKRRQPSWVSFSTASDAFQCADEVLEITYRCMSILLSRGIGVSFLTKGFVPDAFLTLFGKHKSLVKGQIGVACLDADYAAMFEPYAPQPTRRLQSAEKLCSLGIDTTVRMDPVIFGVTDSEQSFDSTIRKVAHTGVRDMVVSSLALRPALIRQFRQGLPSSVCRLILDSYAEQPFQKVNTSGLTTLLPAEVRQDQYNRVKGIAASYNIRCSICGCKNPDLPFEPCQPFLSSVLYDKPPLFL